MSWTLQRGKRGKREGLMGRRWRVILGGMIWIGLSSWSSAFEEGGDHSERNIQPIDERSSQQLAPLASKGQECEALLNLYQYAEGFFGTFEAGGQQLPSPLGSAEWQADYERLKAAMERGESDEIECAQSRAEIEDFMTLFGGVPSFATPKSD